MSFFTSPIAGSVLSLRNSVVLLRVEPPGFTSFKGLWASFTEEQCRFTSPIAGSVLSLRNSVVLLRVEPPGLLRLKVSGLHSLRNSVVLLRVEPPGLLRLKVSGLHSLRNSVVLIYFSDCWISSWDFSALICCFSLSLRNGFRVEVLF